MDPARFFSSLDAVLHALPSYAPPHTWPVSSHPRSLRGVIAFELGSDVWVVDTRTPEAASYISHGPAKDAECTVACSFETLQKLSLGQQSVPGAIMSRKISVTGNRKV